MSLCFSGPLASGHALVSRLRRCRLTTSRLCCVVRASSRTEQPLLPDQLMLEAMAAAQETPAGSGSRASNSSCDHETVPKTWQEVITVFFQHPSVLLPSAAILLLGSYRLLQPWGVADLFVAVAVAAFWLLQEWVVHAKLLHSDFSWFGKEVHEHHHALPYFHVSIDPPELIGGVMSLAAVVFFALFQGSPLAYTATLTYFTMGLTYEWLHYVVHTQWVPPESSSWLRAIRRHHMLHHCRNEGFWLSFTLPAVDALFGTLPAKGAAIPMTPMARKPGSKQQQQPASVQQQQQAAAAVSSRRS